MSDGKGDNLSSYFCSVLFVLSLTIQMYINNQQIYASADNYKTQIQVFLIF
jgi:hypothetical protein